MSDESASVIPLLAHALTKIRSTPPRIITSPPTQPRRAAVALVIRVIPPRGFPQVSPHQTQPSLQEFFQLDWVNAPGAVAEILFLKRENAGEETAAITNNRVGKSSEAHVAFPGGRAEEGDEGGCYTAMRQTWEEIGLDLAERDFTCVGQLDDREITTSLGKRLLMILSPFVFLQLSPAPLVTDPVEGTTLHWLPISSFLTPKWSTVSVDCSSRLAPRQSLFLRYAIRALIGNMSFPALLLPDLTRPEQAKSGNERSEARLEKALPPKSYKQLKLWGLSLGMTLDLLSFMAVEGHSTPGSILKFPDHADADDVMGVKLFSGDVRAAVLRAPSLTSVFPRFSYPDVNFWIWVFGKRYREVVRGWEASVKTRGAGDRRVNWTGAALSTFYAAIRKALVVVIVVRAILVLTGAVFSAWWVFFR